MATTGTVGTFSLDIASLIEHAVRRCKLPSSVQTPETTQIAVQNLQLLLYELSNYGINLWAIEKIVVGLVKYKETYALPAYTMDVLNVFLRTAPRADGAIVSSDGQATTFLTDNDQTTRLTQLSTGGNFKAAFSTATVIRIAGLLHSGTATRSLVYETSQDGTTWTTLKALGTQTYSDLEWIWTDFDPGVSALNVRVRDTLTTTALSAYEFYVSVSGTEIQSARLNRDDFTNLPNKVFAGRPLQFWFDRRRDAANLHLWPSPNDIYQHLVIWRHRLLEDVGTDLTFNIDIPTKWFEAVVSGLASRLSVELPGVDPQLSEMLEARFSKALERVEIDEVDNSIMRLSPNMRLYTR